MDPYNIGLCYYLLPLWFQGYLWGLKRRLKWFTEYSQTSQRIYFNPTCKYVATKYHCLLWSFCLLAVWHNKWLFFVKCIVNFSSTGYCCDFSAVMFSLQLSLLLPFLLATLLLWPTNTTNINPCSSISFKILQHRLIWWCFSNCL